MPLEHERTFRVRHYECDAYGHVNHAHYLRYMQESALDASAAAGYDMDWYAAHNRLWLIRQTDITYLRPLQYGDSVIVKTWVEDFRRIRSRRAYEMRLADSDEKVAEASTDWIYLNSETNRPVRIPDELIGAFFPEGLPEEAPRREPFPEAPPPPPGVFTIHHPVEWRDVDPEGHLNNANYMAYIENCTVQAAESFGWPMSRMIEEEGFGIVARRYRLEYIEPAVMGDTLLISTYVSDVKRASAIRHNTVHRLRDNQLLARAHVLWAWFDLAKGRLTRIPPHFIKDFAPNVVD